ncbi:MAG TPA: hypothetical protein VGP06_02970 [Janthinobacterium sp.]|jgi:hypothetical protein|nr:hypothetical protein [Janthinobacterium sp.]
MPVLPDFFPHGCAARAGLACLLLAGSSCGPAQAAPPSTFGTVVGNAVLCLNNLDNKYFYSYLAAAFGVPYKHDGGAFWFKTTGATLWGAPILEVIVSDDTSALAFIGAIADTTPENLEPMVTASVGLHYTKKDASAFPVRAALAGSKIIYFNTRSKVYCAEYKPLPPPDAR